MGQRLTTLDLNQSRQISVQSNGRHFLVTTKVPTFDGSHDPLVQSCGLLHRQIAQLLDGFFVAAENLVGRNRQTSRQVIAKGDRRVGANDPRDQFQFEGADVAIDYRLGDPRPPAAVR